MSAPPWTHSVPVLEGAIVNVREIACDDAGTLFDLLSDPEVTAHLAPSPPSIDAMTGFIAWSRQQRAEAKAVCFGIVPHGLNAAVGIIQLRALDPNWFAAEWGFALGKSFWSTGVFMDAANTVLQFAFDVMKIDRLEARAAVPNGRGHAALQKLGARAEGKLTKSFRTSGRTANQLLWTLRRDDWCGRTQPRQRVSASEAAERIARAIQDAQRALEAEHTRARLTNLYPFFLTDSTDE